MAEDFDSASAANSEQSSQTTGPSRDPEMQQESALTPEETGKLLKAYHNLSARRVDSVGDYAGNETFLIDGDSILLRCFQDKRLDMREGLQLLHAVYIVETFLYDLVRHKCRFHIAFFESLADLCIPEHVPASYHDRYRLVRAVVIRHLSVNLRTTHPEVEIRLYQSLSDERFQSYMQNTPPYFLMLHDGATTRRLRSAQLSAEQTSNQPIQQRLVLRSVILSFISEGHNVALINEVECKDSKVVTVILENRSSSNELHSLPKPVVNDLLEAPEMTQDDDVPPEWLAILEKHSLTERQT